MSKLKELQEAKRMEKLLYPSTKISLKDKLNAKSKLSKVKKKLSKANRMKKRYIKVNRDFDSELK